ncbi:deoxyguanosinetriphosphate triphosphohydrolase [Mangrovibrevibacter kandeliae]|uniref:deoxyguanosinetriphosphate triphosphohydrolase n=1 Tax=Mangrovibrevibacter kandeliae TaxID=2968473 RepID=UPI0021196F17|nr:deoxyguanosinetriphosphate triphosphohydrolase [Aurantimonas sp. CSK15Z-1]MCQ8781752.1 deoxyguanosinetriphosphate triphosphohydrolase [Aurantimonas sp. CSK15Z-1]
MDEGLSGIGMGLGQRAPYAVPPTGSRGRLFAEPESRTRTPYQRDRDRIVHSAAFRRLKHKTQVFIADDGDHFRTRLTHTIEVSQIARAFARAFRLDEDLTEGVALVHDFGHTPFGHAGERALNRKLEPLGGFDHNAQSLRVVTTLERRYAEFDGLNLSWETLEGLVKHNGPLAGPHAVEASVPRPILDFDALFPLDLARHASLEAQAAAISDDIAYNTHDIDDGLRAGLIEVEDLRDLALAGDILAEVDRAYPTLDRSRRVHEIMRRHITRMVEDVIATTIAGLRALDPADADAVRDTGRTLVRFSPAMRDAQEETRRFLFARVYRHESVMRVMRSAEAIVSDLYDRYMSAPEEMRGDWSRDTAGLPPDKLARRVADYLAGMTDTYAVGEHRRLFDATPDLR